MKNYELELYCICCQYIDEYHKEDGICFVNIYDIDDFMKELKKIIKNFLNENPLSCVMIQSSICFNIDDFMQSLLIESTEEFKQEIEKFFYEDEEN